MRASLAFTAAFVAGALAGPIVKREDEVTVIDVDTTVDVVYTTVYGSPSSASAAATTTETPASPPQSEHKWQWGWTRSWTVSSSAPTSTSAPAPPPPTTSAVAVESSSSSEAAPVTSAPASTASSAPLPTDSMASAAVVRHNDHRRNHTDTVDVAWDADLAATAQDVANMCNWTHVTTANGGGYGQNYGASPSGSTIEDAIEMWYSETTMFPDSYYGQLSPANRGCTVEADGSFSCPEYGHFTQMIWKASTKIGCAIADCSGGYVGGTDSAAPSGSEDPVFQVCNYSPAGNVNPTLTSEQEGEASMLAWASSVGYPDNLAKPTGLPPVSS
ncbi:PR-1-like protein [Viridothelium virens]|uniref:PR-1-like protein n=1 Tax=Viridothelium virens TaxID=1048519 RepID=A0A6A6HF03_VIRVR|nr:PR-1-like protein [Viridothelium virens]